VIAAGARLAERADRARAAKTCSASEEPGLCLTLSPAPPRVVGFLPVRPWKPDELITASLSGRRGEAVQVSTYSDAATARVHSQYVSIGQGDSVKIFPARFL
jgi:hypothetical protein